MTGKKNMGSATARKIEARLRLPAGWVDQNNFGKQSVVPLALQVSEEAIKMAKFIDSLPKGKREILEKLLGDWSSTVGVRRRRKPPA